MLKAHEGKGCEEDKGKGCSPYRRTSMERLREWELGGHIVKFSS